MTDIVERLRFNANRKSNLDADKASLLEAAAEIERLKAALQAMLDCHGKPHRADWISDAAYQHAIEVDARARRALEPKP